MKLEVFERSTQKSIATYSAPVEMFDFQEWKDSRQEVVPLSELSKVVADLNSTDPETGKPVSNPMPVDLYLPDPLKDKVISGLKKNQTNMEETSITKQVLTPLKSIVILSAVVVEILQNHRPHEAYEVRISDG